MAAIEALNGTFLTLKRFSMPTGNDTRDAVALSLSDGTKLVSAYTLMIKWIIMHFWALVVLCGVAFFIGRKPSHNRAAVTVQIWNTHSSPTNVALLTARYILHMRGEIWYPIMWTILAVIIVTSSNVAPILLTDYLLIGNSAPVNPIAIYVPDIVNNSNQQNIELYILQIPATFRAASAVPPADSVTVSEAGNLTINYSYQVSGTEFGLQHAPDLVLKIEGSCTAEYGWWDPRSPLYTDYYFPFGDTNAALLDLWAVSTRDGGPPFPKLNLALQSSDTRSNSSYAMLVSSIGRFSVSSSTDPWYQTGHSPGTAAEGSPFNVTAGRPPLSCWETNTWFYRGASANVNNLTSIPNLVLPGILQQTLASSLGVPMIFNVAIRLGRSALASSATGLPNGGFDAGRSSVYQDMQHLVQTSYMATKNLLAETTMYQDIDLYNLRNIVANPDGSIIDGAGDFVVSSPDLMTFSVRTLIVIPVVLVGLLILNIIVGLVPTPWRMTHALHASVLYSHLHEAALAKMNAGTEAEKASAVAPGANTPYTRRSAVAFHGDRTAAPIKPSYTKAGGLQWVPVTKPVAQPASERPSQVSG
ncbi:hypothetical protein MMC11_006067 [Xylographa trunciseda]|nr:hypothetical protein [Xylographa trunciseda]